MEEQRKILRPDGLASLGLARRETEILAWAAIGKTDAEIAVILDISARTAEPHARARLSQARRDHVAASRLAFGAHGEA